ncbi:hypothetical protein A4A49_17803 [Nicotiana attenuata]|uniref:Uncharacterized protein n=1 Tax=Nicotiana attenuata TaxID=49451 RepID=A0A314KIK4_NICAT|nr:hypothetical protein A4A49_17803 [Nicotiana attenuata]
MDYIRLDKEPESQWPELNLVNLDPRTSMVMKCKRHTACWLCLALVGSRLPYGYFLEFRTSPWPVVKGSQLTTCKAQKNIKSIFNNIF